jgi:RNA polymerase sigma-70 factor (ECF subfamily)
MEKDLTDIVLRIKTGEEKAFRELYDRYAGRLHAFVLKILKSRVLTDDVVQDVFVQVWEQRDALDPQKNFQSFLFTITRNRVLNILKRSSVDSALLREIFLHAPQSSNTTETHLAFTETTELLRKAMDLLPPGQKRVFELCKINGLSYEEAAQELNISPGTINAHMVKSIKFIRDYFSHHEHAVLLTLVVCLLGE